MAWFLKRYRCEECGTRWTDEWSCACNDRCPQCDVETETDDYDNLSVVVRQRQNSAGWMVKVSPNSAEHTPDYVATFFVTQDEACDFANRETARLKAERLLG